MLVRLVLKSWPQWSTRCVLPKCWYYKHELPHPAWLWFFSKHKWTAHCWPGLGSVGDTEVKKAWSLTPGSEEYETSMQGRESVAQTWTSRHGRVCLANGESRQLWLVPKRIINNHTILGRPKKLLYSLRWKMDFLTKTEFWSWFGEMFPHFTLFLFLVLLSGH